MTNTEILMFILGWQGGTIHQLSKALGVADTLILDADNDAMQELCRLAQRKRISAKDWQWYGNAGHFICSDWCRFHLLTIVGDYLVSTVGEYIPDAPVREIMAESRGVTLVGMGDDRRADYMKKIGFEEVGFRRTYETMVFKLGNEHCTEADCGCNMPMVGDWQEQDFDGYNSRGEATAGHYALCHKWAALSATPATVS